MKYTKINDKQRMSNAELRNYIDNNITICCNKYCWNPDIETSNCCYNACIGGTFLILMLPVVIIMGVGTFAIEIYLCNRTDNIKEVDNIIKEE